MRFIKFGLLITILVLAIYAAVMYSLVDESNSFTIEKEINYPVEKVYPQFNQLQNFTRWNDYFSSSRTMRIEYYKPYEGKGAAISFDDPKNEKSGELFIRYHNPDRTLRMQVFEGEESNPTLVDVKFVKAGPEQTRIIWNIHTPKRKLLSRITNLWTEDEFTENLNRSMANLNALLGNKVEKEYLISSIKYDSLMVEKQEGQLLLGINVSATNTREALFRNIVMNHNKVYNFVMNDLDKREDEFGYAVLVTGADNYKDKDVSYFLGIPLSKRVGVSDNSFSFRTINETQSYVIYYQGSYSGRVGSIQKLLQNAKKENVRYGDLQQVFLEVPESENSVRIKLILPVFR